MSNSTYHRIVESATTRHGVNCTLIRTAVLNVEAVGAIAVTASTRTIVLTDAFTNVDVGQEVTITGMANSGNNITGVVATNVDADTITLTAATTTLQDETGPATARIISDEETSVSIKVVPIQFRERDVDTGGGVVQQTNYWMIPARRLKATSFPYPPKPGDRMIFDAEIVTIDDVGQGVACGEVVRWDVGVTGQQL